LENTEIFSAFSVEMAEEILFCLEVVASVFSVGKYFNDNKLGH